jgi:hypothetical protein
MIRGGFLSEEDRKAPIALARDGWPPVARRGAPLCRCGWMKARAAGKRPRFCCSTTDRVVATTAEPINDPLAKPRISN